RQHYGDRGALRRRRPAAGRRPGGSRPPGLSPDRHGDQYRAGPRIHGQPAADSQPAGALAPGGRRPAGRGRRRGSVVLGQPGPVRPQFRFLSGARLGHTEVCPKSYIAIGRHPLSDVRFDAERDLDVSTRHAAVVRRGDGFVLQDLSSKNGTFLNGKRAEGDVLLRDGDVISFGAKGPALEFHLLPDEEAGSTTMAETAAARGAQPRDVVPAQSAPGRRSSTTMRIRMEVARQTRSFRAK